MRRLLVLLLGLAAYAASMATLLVLVGFSGNLLVPKSVDLGGGAPLAEAVGIDALLLALFGLQHSVMARRGFKRAWARVVPAAAERSTYGLAACAVLALLFRYWVPIDAPVAWRVEHRVGVVLLWLLFALGWALALASTFLIDHFALFGLRQAVAGFRGQALPEGGFGTPGLYRWVRHPLYLGLLLGFWSAPVMTAGHLLFALGLSAYIAIGIAFEERDLLLQFGERYRRYREQAGVLLPKWRRHPTRR